MSVHLHTSLSVCLPSCQPPFLTAYLLHPVSVCLHVNHPSYLSPVLPICLPASVPHNLSVT